MIRATQSSLRWKAEKLHASVVFGALGTDTTRLKNSRRSAPPGVGAWVDVKVFVGGGWRVVWAFGDTDPGCGDGMAS